ncbi:MAG: hydroxymethylbilane synthase [Candidatus Fervidibacterota bacterium]
MEPLLRVGTRGSKLALVQTEWVIKALKERYRNLRVETVVIRTLGDIIADRPLREVSGKGFFIKEIEAALLKGEIDLAVHSLKDMPSELPEGLSVVALCNRIEPRDVLVVRGWKGDARDWQEVVAGLPVNAKVGTSSLRRQAQLKHAFPHWQLCELRGNVDTRLRKLDEGQYDAIVVAAAGLMRLGVQERIACFLPADLCCPAAGQGALAVEARTNDADTLFFLHPLDELPVRVEVEAERAATQELGAGCHAAVGALARLTRSTLSLWVAAAEPDGSKVWRHFAQTTLPDDQAEWLEIARGLGRKAARNLARGRRNV